MSYSSIVEYESGRKILTLTPDLSILIPARNAERFIYDSLQSCLTQETTRRFEIVVVDDHSTDKTPVILNSIAAKHLNVRVLSNPRHGVGSALQFGLKECRAPLIFRLDADDLMSSNRLQIQADFMDANPEFVLCGSQIELFGDGVSSTMKNEYHLDDNSICDFLAKGNAFADPSVSFRRVPALSVGGFRNFFNGAEQYDLWMRLSFCGKLANLPGTLTKYRIHNMQFTGRRTFRVLFSTSIVQFAWLIGITQMETFIRLKMSGKKILNRRIPIAPIPKAISRFLVHTLVRLIRQ